MFEIRLFLKYINRFSQVYSTRKSRNSYTKVNINNLIFWTLSMKQYFSGIVWVRMSLKVQRWGIRLLKRSCRVIGVVEWLIISQTWHAFLSVSGMLDIHHSSMKHISHTISYEKNWGKGKEVIKSEFLDTLTYVS